ncbi:acyltransferase family protein [Vibrio sp. 10N.286.48.B8]|uniref:acyltransferase family protein n=1 Tax=Vibrio sp. 10N.286.48.B8 TaxID=2056189 RepID=UPI0015E6ECF0|nr:acyltransferase family protein [Vibrio sp. 10N.286.48.B8]
MVKLIYRPDIDGLRALAVLSVVIYHFDPNIIPGGFLGVDIFFVISGYLITKIISHEAQNKSFNYRDFYLRRIKRILPSFYTVLIICLIISAFLYEESDLRSVIKAALSSVLFISNVNFAIGLDYFSPNALEQPLLHFWSLSVEEQYYFLIPILITYFIGVKGNLRSISIIFSILFIGSILFATYLTLQSEYESISYYLLPTRMYSMLIGSLVVFWRLDQITIKKPDIVCLLALLFLLASLFLIDKSFLFPGIGGLVPIVATAVLVSFGNCKGLHSLLLSSRIATTIGKVSFTLYLVHWPVMSFARYILMRDIFTLYEAVILALIIIFFTFVVYFLVEDRIRKYNISFKRATILLFILPSFIVVSMCFSIYFGWFKQNENLDITTYDNDISICHNKKMDTCIIGDGSTNIAFVGDSHAAQYGYLLKENTYLYDWSIYFRSSSSCPAISTMDSSRIKNINIRNRCDAFKAELNDIYDKYNTVFISQKWDSYLDTTMGVTELDNYLNTNKSKIIILVTQVPEYEHDVLRAHKFAKENTKTEGYLIANKELERLSRKYSNVYLLDTAKYFNGISNGINRGVPLYRDSHHINVEGAKYLSSKFRGPLNESY